MRGTLRIVLLATLGIGGSCLGCHPGDPVGDGDADGDLDADADADAEEEPDGDAPTDADEEVSWRDPWCVAGHDPAAPTLRTRTMVPFEPAAMAEARLRETLQLLIDTGSMNYLYVFDFSDPAAPTLSMARGEPVEGDAYRLAEGTGSEPSPIEVSGNYFTTRVGAVDRLVVEVDTPMGNFQLPVREVRVDGTFETSERCSIGELIEDGMPSRWRYESRIVGKITVRDALETPVQLGTESATLCAWLSGEAWSGGCLGPPARWTYPPDTTAGGEDAWSVDIRLAATAVLAER